MRPQVGLTTLSALRFFLIWSRGWDHLDHLGFMVPACLRSTGTICVPELPPAGLEPTTHAFRFALVSQLPGLYLCLSSRLRQWPS